MQRMIRNSVTICTVFVLLASGGAVAAQTIPYYAEGFGVFNSADATYSAPGVGTCFGRYDNFGGVQVMPTDDPLVLLFESAAANLGISGEDELTTVFQNGVLTLTPVDVDDETGEPIFTAVWEADALVTGGAGKFAQVQPGQKPLQLTAINDPFKFSDPHWNFKWTLTGKIDLGGDARVKVFPFKVKGNGLVAELPAGPTPWTVAGTASGLGRYTSPTMAAVDANTVSVDEDDRFKFEEGRVPFSGLSTFLAADRSELVLAFEGFITILPDGQLRWVADFTPVIGDSTGRFEDVTAGSVVMLATSPPLDGGSIPFAWNGDGHLSISQP